MADIKNEIPDQDMPMVLMMVMFQFSRLLKE